MIKIVKDELTELMGSNAIGLNLESKPAVISNVWITRFRKNNFYRKISFTPSKKYKKKPLLVACDIYRPAAIDQLNVIAEQLGVDIYQDREEKIQ